MKVGIIGLGVGERHIHGFLSCGTCEVVAICDNDPSKLDEVAGRFPSARAEACANAILSDSSIDAVSIATFDQYHCNQVVAALNSGKHVFVEKPLCLTREELDQIIRTANDNPDLKLTSNLILRRAPRFVELRRKIKDGRFGEIFYMEGDYNYGRLSKILGGWRGEASFYSVMHGGGIHLIDLLTWLASCRVASVMAMGTRIAVRDTAFKHNDTVVAILKFENESLAKVVANFGCVHPHFHQLSVYGTAATFTQNHFGGAAIYDSRDPDQMPREVVDEYPGVQKGDMIPSFVRAILNDHEPEVSKQEVFDVMAVSLAIEEAVNTGAQVPVQYG